MHVEKLRNKQIIPPESFDCTTISFSDLPAFQKISEQCTPSIIVVFLGQIYSAFDAILPRFDVYKVETVADSYMVSRLQVAISIEVLIGAYCKRLQVGCQ